MKLGIITYYNVVNYGSVLLAYAMESLLTQMGHEVVFLQFHRDRDWISKDKSIFRKIRLSISPNAIKSRNAEKEKTRKFEEFKTKYINIGRNYDIPQNLDLIIVGSDQIFDCKYEFNDFQFAINASCKRHISYAPSFGEFELEDLNDFAKKEQLVAALQNFEAHSARDINTKAILEKILNKEIRRVLDPVLLYGFDDEKSIWNKKLIEGDYLIVYAWGGSTTNAEFQESVCRFAKSNNLVTVSIGDRRPWCDIDYSSASPIEFFCLYANCKMIITNMFHGTCFSIINEKPFFSLVMPHNKNKLGDLLEYLNLKDQIITDVTSICNRKIPSIDYDNVKVFLNRERKSSMEYLSNSIGTGHEK